MKTSHFFKRNFKSSKKENLIAISVGIPKSYNGDVYKALAPTWAMINKYKKDGNEKEYIEEYEKIFKDCVKALKEMLTMFDQSHPLMNRNDLDCNWFMNEVALAEEAIAKAQKIYN